MSSCYCGSIFDGEKELTLELTLNLWESITVYDRNMAVCVCVFQKYVPDSEAFYFKHGNIFSRNKTGLEHTVL